MEVVIVVFYFTSKILAEFFILGTIPFKSNSVGFNPRQYFQLYLEKLHPESKYLFNHAQLLSKKGFNVRKSKVWFRSSKMGKNEISKAVPELCEAAGVEKCKNNQLRPTAIMMMKRAGAEDREIIKISGHLSKNTLQHYDATLEKDRQLFLSKAISGIPTSSLSISSGTAFSSISSGTVVVRYCFLILLN